MLLLLLQPAGGPSDSRPAEPAEGGPSAAAGPGSITLHESVRKSGLMGFCDVAPGENKVLRIVYLLRVRFLIPAAILAPRTPHHADDSRTTKSPPAKLS